MVTRAVRNPGNFTVGASDVYVGDYGDAKGDSRDVGITQGGVSYSQEVEFREFDDADQYLGVVGLAKIGERLEVTFAMKENVLENMKLAWGLTADQISEGDNTVYFGGDATVEYKTLYVDGVAPGGGTANYTFWKAYPISASEVELTKDENTIFEVTMLIIEDTTKTAKQRLGQRIDTYDDETAPSIDSITPVDEGTDIAVDTTIEWTFSEDIQQRDITTGNFNVTDATGAEIAGTLSYSSSSFVVTFTPDANLANDTLHLTFVSGEVRDMAGNAMGDNHRTSFTTVAGT